MAENFPDAQIVSVSNSASQKAFIMEQAARRGLPNLEVITADMTVFQTDDRFDRIATVEMFEHMANWPDLLKRSTS